MRRLRPLFLSLAGIGVTTLALAAPLASDAGPAATAQTARTVTLPGGALAPGTTSTVSWSGFEPGPAYIYVCLRSQGRLPVPQECYGDTLVTGVTGPDGKGSAPFQVRSALTPIGYKLDTSGAVARPGGDQPLDCRSFEQACSIVVSECSAVVGDLVSAQAGYSVPPGERGVYNDDPLTDITWTTVDYGDGVVEVEATLTPKPVVVIPDPPVDPPPPVSGPTVLAKGSDLGGAVHTRWGRAIASELDIVVRTTTGGTQDYLSGIDGVIAGTADFAYAGAPASVEQVTLATTNGQSLVYVPLSISTVGVGYNAFPLLPMRDVRISAQSLSAMLWSQGQPGTTIGSGVLGADQGTCQPAAQRQSVVFSQAADSEAHLSVSGYLDTYMRRATPPPIPWRYGVTDDLPPDQTFFQPQTGHQDVATAVDDPRQPDGPTNLAFGARFGLMDTTWAIEEDLPLAFIQNAKGEFVQPSAEGALATLATSTIGDDNIVDIDEWSQDAKAYPMVVVQYAVAPTTLTEDFTAVDADAVRKALTYMVSAAGQTVAEEEGFVPLTADLATRAQAAIVKIGSLDPSATTSTSSTTTTTTTTPTAATTPAAGGGTPTTVRPATPAGTPTATTRPAAATPTTVRAATPTPRTATQTPAAAAPTPARSATNSAQQQTNIPVARSNSAAPTSPASSAASPAAQTRPPTSAVATTGRPQATPTATVPAQAPAAIATQIAELRDPPLDAFSSLLAAMPVAPAFLPLGAAGATAAVAGQSINLWRMSRRRNLPTEL